MKTDIEKLKELAIQVSEKDKKIFDRVYKEILYPKMERAAKEFKENYIQITDNCHDNPMFFRLKEITNSNKSLQDLIETSMKPYLEEKGFIVAMCSPKYHVKVKW